MFVIDTIVNNNVKINIIVKFALFKLKIFIVDNCSSWFNKNNLFSMNLFHVSKHWSLISIKFIIIIIMNIIIIFFLYLNFSFDAILDIYINIIIIPPIIVINKI